MTTYTDYLELRRWAEIHSDMQANRIGLFNKVGRKADGDSTKERPNAVALDPETFAPLMEHAAESEKVAARQLLLAYRRVAPKEVQEWAKASPGIGEHTMAMLLGCTGHPRIAYPFIWESDETGKRNESPTAMPPFLRTVSALRQYCGVGDPASRHTRGMSQEDALRCGNPRAKRTLWLMVQGIIKVNRGPYRDLYDQIKTSQAWRLEDEPEGHSDWKAWSLGHLHNHAIRIVMKTIVKDLWNVCPVPEDLLDVQPQADPMVPATSS